MKRSAPLRQRTPLKPGKGFKAKAPPPRPVKTLDTYTPRARPMAVPAPGAANADSFKPAPKDRPLQHQGYMRLVRGLPCARCGWFQQGGIQFAHRDIASGKGSKGLAIKSDCRQGYPACGPHDGLPGCHFDIGTGAAMPKAQRHEFEARAGAETRTAILDAGLWPASLPRWPADPERPASEPETRLDDAAPGQPRTGPCAASRKACT